MTQSEARNRDVEIQWIVTAALAMREAGYSDGVSHPLVCVHEEGSGEGILDAFLSRLSGILATEGVRESSLRWTERFLEDSADLVDRHTVVGRCISVILATGIGSGGRTGAPRQNSDQ